jgi:hypothetical protein
MEHTTDFSNMIITELWPQNIMPKWINMTEFYIDMRIKLFYLIQDAIIHLETEIDVSALSIIPSKCADSIYQVPLQVIKEMGIVMGKEI